MNTKTRLRAELDRAAALRVAGDFAGARAVLTAVAQDPDRSVLGPETALGLPRKLHAAHLRLAKAEADPVARAGWQFHLVPPPEVLAPLVAFSLPERRALAEANRQPVPRVIHQIWIGSLPVPPACADWARHASAQGYGYQLWRETELAALGVPRDRVFAARLAAGDYPGAVDAARYIILAEQGGIYLDCDWAPARNDLGFHDLLPLIGLTAWAEDTPRKTGIGSLFLGNSFIATPPGHPAMIRLRDGLAAVADAIPGAPAWWTTGPLIFTLMARGGAVSVAGAGLIAGLLPDRAPRAEVEALRGAEGLLIGWKSW